ncbi:PREDICTED: probable receptor-like protein kinase At5g47070 [Tarenaya hassleriana]|uniref:probable receptor-like protein kinase At5g47070 n=1 Tax=Tarenaya hassleriana TaxID=28532 RepID=UPI00053CAA73|nr:PREDICTED: probable receptor-like protein kinase At5g47070 [Tarenaya hassleriana]
MSCLFLFRSKKHKSKDIQMNNDNNRRRRDSLPRSAPELTARRNPSDPSPSFNLPTPRSLPSPRSIGELYREREDSNNLRVFSYRELSDATDGFNRKLKIGEGGFGSVYRGRLLIGGSDSPLVVAIKKLNQRGLQGHKEWLREVEFLGVVKHPNVVRLLGYCSEDGERGIERLLVYEFMPYRSLEDHLFGRSLPWKQRLEIMHGAALGLSYLHSGLPIEVIYRDFKSSNVLLDEDFRPKLSDFGLVREGPQGDNTHVTTARVGTQGYAAPEYVRTGHLRSQSDVYSFGVVLYEIITGRRTIERNRPAGEEKLLEWVRQFPAESRRFSMIVDPRLRNNYRAATARRVAKLADSCLNRNDKERPSMAYVADTLKSIIEECDGGDSSTSRHLPGGPVRGSSRGISVRG